MLYNRYLDFIKFKCDYLNSLKKEVDELQEKIYRIEKTEISTEVRERIVKNKLKKKDFTHLTDDDYNLINKICSMCKVSKPLTEYHLCKNGRFGRHSKCSICTCLYRKKIYNCNKNNKI